MSFAFLALLVAVCLVLIPACVALLALCLLAAAEEMWGVTK